MKELAVKMRIDKRVSKKTGNPYTMLVIEFGNGYTFETMLSNEQVYILANVLESSK